MGFGRSISPHLIPLTPTLLAPRVLCSIGLSSEGHPHRVTPLSVVHSDFSCLTSFVCDPEPRSLPLPCSTSGLCLPPHQRGGSLFFSASGKTCSSNGIFCLPARQPVPLWFPIRHASPNSDASFYRPNGELLAFFLFLSLFIRSARFGLASSSLPLFSPFLFFYPASHIAGVSYHPPLPSSIPTRMTVNSYSI